MQFAVVSRAQLANQKGKCTIVITFVRYASTVNSHAFPQSMREIGKLDLKALQQKFPGLKVKEEIITYTVKSKQTSSYDYIITGLPGNNELELYVWSDEVADTLSKLLESKLKFTTGFFSVINSDSVEVLLTPISAKTATASIHSKNAGKGKYQIASINLNYHGNEINILLEGNNDNLLIHKLATYAVGVQADYKNKITATISGYKNYTSAGYSNDIRAILTSALFDFEFSYGLGYEPTSIQVFSTNRIKHKKYAPIPESEITLLYKNYIPELIQYLHIAERVDYLPFKFLCYYHIIEYFADKSAYRIISSEVKRMFQKPDFHLMTDNYVAQAVEIFKKENEKLVSDKIKIERVIKQFVTKDELSALAKDAGIDADISKEAVFDGAKPLKLPAVNLVTEGNFYGDLTKRIYAMRCSIVHSNPDFDESKAVPFNPTPINLSKLKLEVSLIAEIAKKVILENVGS